MAERSDLFAEHSRSFRENRFVYPVISRRSGGLSIGVNLNPDKVCNFDCIYCQVDRTRDSETQFVEIDRLVEELDAMLGSIHDASLFEDDAFVDTPDALRALQDIAFSGDGEPTTYRNLEQIVQACVDVKQRRDERDLNMVLITNASMFHREHVRRALELFDRHHGVIWAKLDAGTDAYYQLIERTKIPFQQVLGNITQAAIRRPIVIQSLFMRVHGESPSMDERRAFCQRLNEIVSAGGSVSEVQIYTIARVPAESFVTALPDREVDSIADQVRMSTGLLTSPYYGLSQS